MKLKLYLSGHVRQVVDGSVVIDVPDDATDEEIADLAPTLEDLVTNWKDVYGVPIPSDVGADETNVEDFEDAEEDDDQDDTFTFVRTPDGKLVLKE